MLASDNREFESTPAIAGDPEDITIAGLLAFLAGHKDRQLVFFHDGRPVKPGYHVTEVKAGTFAALDCGANPESWTEIFVQLWDVNEDRTHMPAGKFSAIIRKVTEHVDLDPSARLTFEVSDGVRPIALYRAALPRLVGGAVHVDLSPRPASCKPRDRWLEEERKAKACCGPSASAQPCCR
ncbi:MULTISPECIES: DUF6428 family protein [unclassified Mesorhizobium]|uniref:DUF6428 family protein n=1 Tax=unclassified Mesorhizobium TaxID=325217 RepID=UPI000FD94800|nr:MULTISPECIES: DUF6428 family protein [unclassified Mesorhizobium]TGR47198.1 hypothetical protein EN842_22825 [bacterium M00.F.Ca.ET.199.01.1.1]TGU36648.1 hypothetical protein EN799_13605 [bacterium M00.F.Ca.ET.156.01.1.1]TGV87836.1 hypothetical protein EN792_009850 [Mesorhizobium sp. M00.F.Ca.ET.149.01.1.1]TGR28910.1 hypothetical protein EN845_11100 [Mesorhizobium sp. M8A.F.Ca.ET.202.01.1.1]TGR29864.1 hypothetical protein EN840_09255 [Mesorhizobium sp. M8A.F.Ca.ET.197.01.1.1]